MSKFKKLLVALLCIACVGFGSVFAACDGDETDSSGSSVTSSSSSDTGSSSSSDNTSTGSGDTGNSDDKTTPTVSKVEISGDAEVTAGSTITLTAKVTMSDSSAYSGTITWASSDTSVATVSSSGVVEGKAAGTTKITATADGVASAEYTVTVKAATPAASATLTSVEISGATEVTVGSKITLTATAKYDDDSTSTTETVTWASSNESVATVSSSGEVEGLTAGTTDITATIGEVTSEKFTVTVNKIQDAEYAVDFTSSSFSDDSTNLNTAIAGANPVYFNSTSYSTSKLSDGIISYIPGASGASSYINNNNDTYYLSMGGYSQSSKVRNFAIDLSSYPGKTVTIAVSFAQTGEGSRALVLTTSQTSQSSESTSYTGLASCRLSKSLYNSSKISSAAATLNYQGVIASNTLYISCTGNIAIFSISVKIDDTVSTYTTTDTASSLSVSGTATVTEGYATTLTASAESTWATSDDSIATVNAGVVTGVGEGTAAISATSGYHVVNTDVAVEKAVLALSESTATIEYVQNGTIELNNYIDSSTNVETDDITWTSSADTIATISGSLLTMVSAGEVTVTAKYSETVYATITLNLSQESAIAITEEYVTIATTGSTTVSVAISNVSSPAIAIVDSTGNDVSSTVSATLNDDKDTLTIATTSATAGVYKITVSDGSNVSDSIIVAVYTSNTGNVSNTASYIADDYVANSGTYSATDTGSLVSITYTTSSSTPNGSSKKSTSDDNVTYTNYLQLNGKGAYFTIAVAEGASNVSVKIYASHTTKGESRSIYLGTTNQSTTSYTAMLTINGYEVEGATENLNTYLQVLSADLSTGTYYVYYGGSTVHVYAIEISYTASGEVIDETSFSTAKTVTMGDTSSTITLSDGDTVKSLDTSIATVDSSTGVITGVAEGTAYVLVESSTGALTLYKVTVSAAVSA